MKALRVIAWILGVVVVLAVAASAALFLWLRSIVDAPADPDRPGTFFARPELAPPAGMPDARMRATVVDGRVELVDAIGRVSHLRGVEVPPLTAAESERPFPMGDDAPFRRLAWLGIDALLLPIAWEALEPEPGGFDLGALAYIRWFLDAAGRSGMLVLVEDYESGGSRCFGGVGAPFWAHRPGIVRPEVASARCRGAFAPDDLDRLRRTRLQADFRDGTWSPDDTTLQDHRINAWFKLADVLRGNAALLGYRLAREPACPADVLAWLHPGRTPCEEAIAGWTGRLARAIRDVDANVLLAVDPIRYEGLWTRADGPWPVSAIPAGNTAMFRALDTPCDRGPDGGTPLASDAARVLLTSDRLAAQDAGAALVVGGIGTADASAGAACLDGLLDASDDGRTLLFLAPSRDDLVAGCLPAAAVRGRAARVAGLPGSFLWEARPSYDGDPVLDLDFRGGIRDVDTVVFVPRRVLFGETTDTEASVLDVQASDGTWRWRPFGAPDTIVWTPPQYPDREFHGLSIRAGRRPVLPADDATILCAPGVRDGKEVP